MKRYKGSPGWFNESQRHSLAAKGIKTRRNDLIKRLPKQAPYDLPYELMPTKVIDKELKRRFGVAPNYSKQKISVEYLKKILPHGSGINGDWNIYEKDGKIIAENYYDTMNEMGFYDRPAYFKIVIDKEHPKDFKLHFTDKTSHYLNQKYMLRDYLENSIAISFEDGKINYAAPLAPQHITQAPLPDTDNDGVPNIYDWDDDNDGVPDWQDTEGVFSIDRYGGQGVFDPFYNSTKDSDLDGIPDVSDLYPDNPFKGREDWAKKPKVESIKFKTKKAAKDYYDKIKDSPYSTYHFELKGNKVTRRKKIEW